MIIEPTRTILPAAPAAKAPERASEKPRVEAAEPAAKVVVRRSEAGGGQFVYEFRDRISGKLIKQFPSETLMALQAQAGSLLDTKA